MITNAVVIIVLLCGSPQGTSAGQTAESQRLPDAPFRVELQRRGLIDLLDHHLQTQPGDDPVATALLQRDLRLERYNDSTRPARERLAAAGQARDILRRLIAEHPGHDEAVDWRLSLGRDLIDREAEPYFNNILFRGGSEEDNQALQRITAEALEIYNALIVDVRKRIDGADELPAGEFTRLADSGRLQRLEQLLPQARYLSMWAAFYRCLALPKWNPERGERLNAILQYLNEDSELIDLPHGVTHYQAQSLLLAGMVSRLQGDLLMSEAMLSKASRVVEGLVDDRERRSLHWVLTLSTLERVRNHRDQQAFDNALQILARYRSQLSEVDDTDFGIRLALGLLEGTVHMTHANSLPVSQSRARQRLLLDARAPLIDLARRHPRFRNEIYRLVFDQLGEVQDPERLDSFEKNVFVARQLERAAGIGAELHAAREQRREADVRRLQSQKSKVLSAAIVVARALLKDPSPLARELRPETRFNLAVCYHEQGRSTTAIEHFNKLVQEHPQFEKSVSAATYAVRLADSLYRRAGSTERVGLRPDFLQALRQIVDAYPDLPDILEHRFRYAQVLQDAARYAEAADHFDGIPAGHPHHVAALLNGSRCRLQHLRAIQTGQLSGEPAALVRKTQAAALELLKIGIPQATPAQMTEARLIIAEAELIDPLGRSSRALEALAAVDASETEDRALLAQAMRLRILAHQAAGDSEAAAAIIPEYIQRDPQGAGPTLLGLLGTLNEEVERAEQAGSHAAARTKGLDALTVARELDGWAEQRGAALDAPTRLSLRLSLGEALLRTGRKDDLQEALSLFEDAGLGRQSADARVIWGMAESLFRLERYEQALPLFNRLYRSVPENTPRWWEALLREIECRHRLDQDPELLYNLIEQKKSFFKEMGGPVLRRQLSELQSDLRRAVRAGSQRP